MPRRRVITVELSQRESDFVDHMKRAANLPADANLMRLALYRLARHLDVPVTADTFALRSGSARAARRRPYAPTKATTGSG